MLPIANLGMASMEPGKPPRSFPGVFHVKFGATGGTFCGCGVCFAFLVTMFDLRKREVPVIEEADLLQVDSEPHRIFPWLVYSIRIQDLQCGKVCFFFWFVLLQLGKKMDTQPMSPIPQPRSPIPCQDRDR